MEWLGKHEIEFDSKLQKSELLQIAFDHKPRKGYIVFKKGKKKMKLA